MPRLADLVSVKLLVPALPLVALAIVPLAMSPGSEPSSLAPTPEPVIQCILREAPPPPAPPPCTGCTPAAPA